jgi:uncharacterized protein
MAASRAIDPLRLDVAAFAAAEGELAGAWPAERLPRLVSATLPPPEGKPRADIDWRVVGERRVLLGAGIRPSLQIEASTEVTLECQRCLQPMRLALEAERLIYFVEGEDAAAALDADNDDDVLALAPALDLQALVEDELLLALPLVPRHEVCPEKIPMQFGDVEIVEADTAHPFASLALLRKDKDGDGGPDIL